MEYAVGEKIKVNGCVYVVVEDLTDRWDDSCARCVLRGSPCARYLKVFGECDCTVRSDRKSVHFEQFGVDFDPTRHQHAF